MNYVVSLSLRRCFMRSWNTAGQDQGKLAEAEPLYHEALAGQRETLGTKHPDTLVSINNMAALLQAQGKLTEAEALFRESHKGFRSLFGHRHPHTVETAHYLGRLLKAQGMHAEAAPLLAMSLEVCALPSCDRSHRVGVKLKHCTGCNSVMYCCPVRVPKPPRTARASRYGWAVFGFPLLCGLDASTYGQPAGAPAGALEAGGGRSQGGVQTAEGREGGGGCGGGCGARPAVTRGGRSIAGIRGVRVRPRRRTQCSPARWDQGRWRRGRP